MNELSSDISSGGGKFKARKNLVMDVTNFEDLYARVMSYDRQENKALIKGELGKIRIAVASRSKHTCR